MRPNQPSHEMKTFIPRDKANHPVRPIALSRPFLHQLKINPYLCHRLGDTPVVPTSCIKGNPVRSRNSARFCKATLPCPLTAATEHTENILQNDATVLQTAVGESKHQFEPSQTGDGKVSFSVGLSQETCLGN